MNLLALALLQSLSFGASIAQPPVPAVTVALRAAAVEAVVVAPALDAQAQLVSASAALTAAEYPSAWPRMFEGRATGKYFGARYYSGSQGRFTSVDPANAGASVDDAQSWNGYAYARNNPLLFVDPGGLAYRICGLDDKCQEITDDQYKNYFQNDKNVRVTYGDVYRDGKKIGSASYRDDRVELFSHAMASRAEASEALIGAFAATSLTFGQLLAPAAGAVAVASGSALGLDGFLTMTAHGATRVAGAAAARGGTLTVGEILAARAGGRAVTQAGGGVVHILEVAPGKFNVVIDGAGGKYVTSFLNVSSRRLANLARNYGWGS